MKFNYYPIHKKTYIENYQKKPHDESNKTLMQTVMDLLAPQTPAQVLYCENIHYKMEGVMTKSTLYKIFFIVKNQDGNRFFSYNVSSSKQYLKRYPSSFTEFNEKEFFKTLKSAPELQEIHDSFLLQYNKLKLHDNLQESLEVNQVTTKSPKI